MNTDIIPEIIKTVKDAPEKPFHELEIGAIALSNLQNNGDDFTAELHDSDIPHINVSIEKTDKKGPAIAAILHIANVSLALKMAKDAYNELSSVKFTSSTAGEIRSLYNRVKDSEDLGAAKLLLECQKFHRLSEIRQAA